MGLFDYFRRHADNQPRAQATTSPGQSFDGLEDPALAAYLRTGIVAQETEQLRNMAVLRCVSLICESIGMLPLNLLRNDATKAPATDHPAYRVLKYKPNTWQTPYEFKSAMQLQVLLYGNAYAQVVRSAGRVIGLVPLFSTQVFARLDRQTLRMVYEVTERDGSARTLNGADVLHLRDLTLDSVRGTSRMRLAQQAIDLAQNADKAATSLFTTGVMAGGAIEVPTPLSETAYARMKKSLEDGYSGAANARKWMLLEEGGKANPFNQSAADAQLMEQRNQQIQEVARAFGVPRPLLMMDDTSWGSGIEQLGIYFVQYGLQHWLTAWEQAIERVLLADAEMGVLAVKFNERALMRGTLNDQSAYLSKALGAGGSAPWITQNEARDTLDMPQSTDPVADLLRNPMTQKGTGNEPAPTA